MKLKQRTEDLKILFFQEKDLKLLVDDCSAVTYGYHWMYVNVDYVHDRNNIELEATTPLE